MAKKEKTKLEKKNWNSSFMLIGTATIGQYTYKLDEKSDKSDWVYNALYLGIDCGEKYGVVYAEMSGGYGSERNNVLYVHGKKEDGKDDYENKMEIDWDDRLDEDVLEDIGSNCFITVGLEKDKNGKVFYKKFLSAYDAINYINEHLAEGTVVNVRGNVKYNLYNDKINVKKEINSIVLSKVDDKNKYGAKFTQTMLLKKDSVGKADKEKGIIPIYATVLEYMKEYKGKEVKQFIPLPKTFEYEIDLTNKELVEKIISKVFKVKKGVTEITFEGDFIEGGALVTPTMDDVPDDIKELIALELYTEEEALAKCTENTTKDKRMVLRKPMVKMVGDEGSKTPVIQKFEGRYDEEDLILDFMYKTDEEEDDDEEDEDVGFDNDSEDDLAFLKDL